MKPRAVTSVFALLPMLLLARAAPRDRKPHGHAHAARVPAAGRGRRGGCHAVPASPERARRWLRWQRALDWRGWTSATVAAAAWRWCGCCPRRWTPRCCGRRLLRRKYASWWLAGWLLADGWRRMDAELLLFAVGNLAWMAATAGLFHLDAPARLCVNYLQDDQRHTGIGLIALAALAGALVLRRVAPSNSVVSRDEPRYRSPRAGDRGRRPRVEARGTRWASTSSARTGISAGIDAIARNGIKARARARRPRTSSSDPRADRTPRRRSPAHVGQHEQLVAGVVGDGLAHTAAGRGERHGHLHAKAAFVHRLELAAVDQAQLDDVDRDLRS